MSYAIVLVQKRQLTAVALLLTMKSSLGTRLQIDSHSAVMERSMEASFPKKRLLSQSRWCSRCWKEIVHMHSGFKSLKKFHLTTFTKSVLFHNIAKLSMNEFMIVIPFEKIKENLGLQLFSWVSERSELRVFVKIDWDTEGSTPFVFRYGQDVVEPYLRSRALNPTLRQLCYVG